MHSIDAFFPKVPKENKLTSAKSAIVKADRNLGFLGRDRLRKVKESVDRCFGTSEIDKLPAVKGVCASSKLKQDDELKFCLAGKVPLAFEVDQTFDELLFLGVLVRVEAGGVENSSVVVWVKRVRN